MFHGLWQSLFIFASGLGTFIADRILTARYDALRTAGGSATTWWHGLVTSALAAVLIAQPLVWPGLGIVSAGQAGLLVQLLGVLLTAAALGLNVWARLRLGQFYAQRAEIQPGHRLIDDGPYAYVRHPIYAGYFLQAIGLLLVVPSIPMLLATIYALSMFSWTAGRDEALLQSELPGYEEYMARTPRFVPNVSALLARR